MPTAHDTRMNPKVSVRRMRVSDFPFVKQLASQTRTYTVPSDYVLWMLSRCHPDLCAVAELRGASVAYVLALTTHQPRHGMFIWQFASTLQGARHRAPAGLAKYIRRRVQEHGIERIDFTAVPGSASLRSIQTLAQKYFGSIAQKSNRLPPSVLGRERQYYLVIRDR